MSDPSDGQRDRAPGSGQEDVLVAVVAGGDEIDELDTVGLRADTLVIATESGLDHALALGLTVSIVIGDVGLMSETSRAAVERAGAHIEPRSAATEGTGLEQGLARAVQLGATRIVVVGGHWRTREQRLANILLLSDDRYADITIEARHANSRVFVVRESLLFAGEVGDRVSLLAVNGPTIGVTTAGLEHELSDAVLEPRRDEGLLNGLYDGLAEVYVRSGTLIVDHTLHPDD